MAGGTSVAEPPVLPLEPDGDRRPSRSRRRWLRRALGLAIAVNLVGALAVGWHIIRQPLTIESLVGRPPTDPAPRPGPDTDGAPAPEPAGPSTDDAGAAGVPADRSPGAGAPVAAPRVQPSAAQVREEKRQIARRVSLPPGVHPTRHQVEGVSEEICKAFDQGYTYAQAVTGLKKAGTRYAVSVSTDDADYAIRTAVSMRCPAHEDKLP